MKKINFYDTCSLLLKAETLFEDPDELVCLSTITLKELENIKTSNHKDPDVKYAARRLIHALNENMGTGKYEAVIFTKCDSRLEEQFTLTDDLRILSCALQHRTIHPDLVFVTNDLCLKHIASCFIDSDHLASVNEAEEDDYSGYKEYTLSEEELIDLYSNQKLPGEPLLINQYGIIKDANGDIVDTVYWNGETHQHVTFRSFPSLWFGNVKPLSNDVYQLLVADSFARNRITMVKGPAGSGKTYLSLGYLMNQLEKHKIDKIIIFCNTVATKNSAKLGYLPGTRDEKLLDSQIGNMLSSKLGGRLAVEQMINDEKLLLLPFSDIRGYDTTGMKAGIYISEAQNLDVELMKLALQRVGEDSICIIDGDAKTQVDDIAFAGANNGMKRASKVYRGEDIYGEVELRIVHRSRIARIAEKM